MKQKTVAPRTVANDKGPMVRMNFELGEAEHIKLKIFAAKSRRTIAEILRELIDKNIPSQN